MIETSGAREADEGANVYRTPSSELTHDPTQARLPLLMRGLAAYLVCWAVWGWVLLWMILTDPRTEVGSLKLALVWLVSTDLSALVAALALLARSRLAVFLLAYLPLGLCLSYVTLFPIRFERLLLDWHVVYLIPSAWTVHIVGFAIAAVYAYASWRREFLR